MAIPKRKRREIVVEGTRYEYAVSGFMTIYVKNLATGEQYQWYKDCKPKWKLECKPSDVRTLILEGKLDGTPWRKM